MVCPKWFSNAYAYEITNFPFVNPALLSLLSAVYFEMSVYASDLKINSPFCVCSKKGDTVDYQKQLKQMLKDLAKEKDTKTEKELPKMSQVCTLEAVVCF